MNNTNTQVTQHKDSTVSVKNLTPSQMDTLCLALSEFAVETEDLVRRQTAIDLYNAINGVINK